MTEYNIIIELPERNLTPDTADALIDQFTQFHPGLGFSALGWVEITLTVLAESLTQAVTTGIALAGVVGGPPPLSVHAMTTAEYDRRPVGVEKMPELLGAQEVAERLGITRQAVLLKVQAGQLIGSKVGSHWVFPAAQFSQKKSATRTG